VPQAVRFCPPKGRPKPPSGIALVDLCRKDSRIGIYSLGARFRAIQSIRVTIGGSPLFGRAFLSAYTATAGGSESSLKGVNADGTMNQASSFAPRARNQVCQPLMPEKKLRSSWIVEMSKWTKLKPFIILYWCHRSRWRFNPLPLWGH